MTIVFQYLYEFHRTQDYFECHELLEEHWKAQDDFPKQNVWVGLIALAVGSYHFRRQNYAGATRSFQNSLRILKKEQSMLQQLGFKNDALIQWVQLQLKAAEKKQPFVHTPLPLQSDTWLQYAQWCHKQRFVPTNEQTTTDEQIIHRHKLRDRTDVIAERHYALQRKKESRKE